MLRTAVSPGSWGEESCLGRVMTVVASSWARTKGSTLVSGPGQRGNGGGGSSPKGGTRYLSSLPQGPRELLRPVAGCRPLHRHRMVPLDLVELRNLREGRQELMALERHFPVLGPWAVWTSPVNTVLALFWVPTHRRVVTYRYTEHWFVNLKHAYFTRTYGTADGTILNVF